MTSEQGCGSPRLCANGCGFFGRPETQDLCSKCYRDSCVEQAQLNAREEISVSSSPNGSRSVRGFINIPEARSISTVDGRSEDHRCRCCSRKVGLAKLGFRCRCGYTYCSKHRYPEEHGCNFDFKAVARDSLVKNNPVVQADKLDERI